MEHSLSRAFNVGRENGANAKVPVWYAYADGTRAHEEANDVYGFTGSDGSIGNTASDDDLARGVTNADIHDRIVKRFTYPARRF